MTKTKLYQAIQSNFPQIEPHDALITAQNFASMELVSAKALLAQMKHSHDEYAPLVAFIVEQLESQMLEPELQPMWERHQIEEDYYHCCGGW